MSGTPGARLPGEKAYALVAEAENKLLILICNL